MFSRFTPAFLAGLLTALASPFFLACSQGRAEGDGRDAATDSVVAAILGSVEEPPPPRSLSPRVSPREQETQPLDIARMGYDRGSPDAPVRVLELSDFGCGYCRLFHQETFPALLEAYVEAGFVQWKFVPFVLGMFPNGLEASIAGECGGEQDQFFPMQRRLFSDQAGWKGSQDPFPLFTRIAEEEGLDVGRFNRCVEGGWRENQVRANIRLGREVGARGTPTFLIDGIPISGALPLDTFRDILDIALTEKGVTPPARGQ
jgi:protein-disulfide isomerase